MAGSEPSTVIHTVGSKVWVRDEVEGWVRGEVIRLEGDSVVVELEEGGAQLKVAQNDAPLQNSDARGVEVRRQRRCARVFGGACCVCVCARAHNIALCAALCALCLCVRCCCCTERSSVLSSMC